MNHRPAPAPRSDKPHLGARIAIALVFAATSALVSWYVQFPAGAHGGDFLVLWRAARIVLEGGDPYQVLKWHGQTILPNPGHRFFYPLPAVGIALPVAGLGPAMAAVVFATVSAALLGFVLTRDGFERVPILLSVPFLECAQFGQTTTLILALGLTRAAGGLTLLKPNIGLPILAWRPSRWAVATAALLFIGTLVISPSWPMRWLIVVRSSYMHRAPVATGIGALALVALARWRRPEARLLAGMTLLPHALYFYDQLPLFVIPATRRESMVLVLASWVGLACALSGGSASDVLHMNLWVVASLYLPATTMILLRSNVSPALEATAPTIGNPEPKSIRP